MHRGCLGRARQKLLRGLSPAQYLLEEQHSRAQAIEEVSVCTGDKFLTQIDQGANKERCSVGPHACFQENRLWHLQGSASKYPRGYNLGEKRGPEELVDIKELPPPK